MTLFRDQLGELVGGVLLAQPVVELVVQPPGGVHRRHEGLVAARVHQQAPELLQVGEDELEQRRPGSAADVVPKLCERFLGLCDQLGDSRWVGLDRLGSGGGGGQRRSCRSAGAFGRSGQEVIPLDHGLQRVSKQGIALAEQLEQGCPACGGGKHLGDVDEQPAAGDAHGPRRRELPHGEPERLHRVGHHLLVTDGDVHAVCVVAGRRGRKQRGDRPALDNEELAAREAPFDVLGATEVRLDPPAQPGQLQHRRVAQGGLLLALRSDRLLVRSARRHRVAGEPLGRDRPLDDLAAAHLVDVRGDVAGDQRLAEPEAGLNGRDPAVAGDRVSREQHARRLREHHLLDHHGHGEVPVVDAAAQAIGDRPLREQ